MHALDALGFLTFFRIPRPLERAVQASRGLEYSKLVDLDYSSAHLAQLSIFDCDAAAGNVAATYAEHHAAATHLAQVCVCPAVSECCE